MKKQKFERMAVSQNQRREDWINAVLQDKEFLMGKYQQKLALQKYKIIYGVKNSLINLMATYSISKGGSANGSYKSSQIQGVQFNIGFSEDQQQHCWQQQNDGIRKFIQEEYDQTKWKSKKDFNAQMNSKDKSWDPIQNTSRLFCEPFVDKKVEFRKSYNGKNGSLAEYFQSKYDVTTTSKEVEIKKQQQLFDSTIPQDTTWKNRVMESQSLRQRAHLNQSLKMKDKQQDQRGLFGQNQLGQLKVNAFVDDNDLGSNSATPEKKVQRFFKLYNSVDKHSQLSKIISEHSPSSSRRNTAKVKEQIIDLQQLDPDSAAQLLNNSMSKSFTNSWQYQIVKPLQNKNFQAREELNDSHILGELDKVKTYYSSVMGKLPPRTSINSPFNVLHSKGVIREELNDSAGFKPRKGVKRYNRTNIPSPSGSQKRKSETQGENRLKYGSIKQAIDKYFERKNNKQAKNLSKTNLLVMKNNAQFVH
ncbi:UNKNOWN [Stylonychia lemnae]|uniref:Uncharacterized protein n=1 Tax=Stylonychia lemnae TaxID=5949 RepID=A0A078A235_STYLE|nr:UNKNOWN [Stylonychia lemnae]|eukprot:CDW74819.1 UNKNOWN [Stylonychia lemnae]